MTPPPVRNAVRVAIVQVLIIVFGVLGTNSTKSWWQLVLEQQPPKAVHWVIDYGVIFLAIPPVWILAYLKIHRDPEASEDTKRTALISGVVLALLLLFIFCLAVFSPWFGAKERNWDKIDAM